MLELLDRLVALYHQQPLAQTVGLIALVIGLSSFSQKDDQRLKYMHSVYALIMGMHFFLLGSYPGAIIGLIACVRSWVASRTRSWQWMLFFMVITLVLTVPNITAWVFALPLLGGLLGTWAFFRESGLRMRVLMLIGTLCWLVHDIVLRSIGGTLIEISFLIMNLLTMFRLWQARKLPTAEHCTADAKH